MIDYAQSTYHLVGLKEAVNWIHLFFDVRPKLFYLKIALFPFVLFCERAIIVLLKTSDSVEIYTKLGFVCRNSHFDVWTQKCDQQVVSFDGLGHIGRRNYFIREFLLCSFNCSNVGAFHRFMRKMRTKTGSVNYSQTNI